MIQGMENSIETAIVVEDYPATRPSLRIAVVTETWPPEVNGVAMTLAKLVQGLSHRNHDVQLIRPRQTKTESPMSDSSLEEVLMRGMPIPRYPELKLGLPSKKNARQNLDIAPSRCGAHCNRRSSGMVCIASCQSLKTSSDL
jgi:hypothetical protein